MRWGRGVRGRDAGSRGRSFRRVESVGVSDIGPEEGRRWLRGVRGRRKQSERCAERGDRGDSLAGVRRIGEVESGASGADGLQGAENGFVGEGGVSPQGDDEFGVAGFSLSEKWGELVEVDFIGAEESGAVFGEGESEDRFWVGWGRGESGGGFGEIDRELLLHQRGGDHEDDEEDEDEIEEGCDIELGQGVGLGAEAGASHDRGVKRCSKTAAHSAAKFSI